MKQGMLFSHVSVLGLCRGVRVRLHASYSKALYIKTKIRTYGNKVYTNFCDLNMQENDTECESFTVISVGSLLVYDNKRYLQVHLDNCAYKIENKQMTDYVDKNLFEDEILELLCYNRIDISQENDPTKSNKSTECMICHYFFLIMDSNFKIIYAIVVTI